ncbi:MAG: DUF4870 domain-containing protein [Vampirovibrionia bacterium]
MENILTKEKEERIIASVMHLAGILPFMGMFIPMLIWILKKDKSFYIALHCLQTLIYQTTGILIFIMGMILYIASFLGVFIATAVSTGFDKNTEPSPIIIVFFFIPFIIFFSIFFFYIIYMLYSILGFILTLAKGDFKYVIIGKRVENYLKKDSTKTNEV